MFSLLSGMYVYFFGVPQYNVLVLGLDNAGKSTFLYQVGIICDRKKRQNAIKRQKQKPKLKLKRGSDPDPEDVIECKSNALYKSDPKLSQILPTMGQNVKMMEFENMTLQFWDLPGQTGFRKIWTHYFNEVHAIVFMVDSADTNRLNEARFELHKLLNEYQLKYAPVLVVANKQDLQDAMHYQSIINTMQIIGTSSSSDLSNQYRPDDDINNNGTLNDIEEHKQQTINKNKNRNEFKNRSIKVMCTCCLNKEGLYDAISWLVYIIPLAKKRLDYVAQFQHRQMVQKKQ